MTPDEALLQAYQLGMDDEGWTDAVMDEAELLLPILLKAGYASVDPYKWSFTPAGVARHTELTEARPDL
jgi:hypothetical protein